MEPPDIQKMEDDAVASRKRRLSSILKAPRTSMKTFAIDQDDCQEEVTRTIDKRRNSRRVSFATTNDILVFSKDVKNTSSDMVPGQNLTAKGKERQDRKALATVENGASPQTVTGLENVSVAPWGVSYGNNKITGNQMDQTIVFGEDSVFMDMTRCHTVTIDKDEEAKTWMQHGTNVEFGRLDQMPFKQLSNTGRSDVDSDFEAFLASISKSSGQFHGSNKSSAAVEINSVALPSSKGDTSCTFSLFGSGTSGVDKENQTPGIMKKQTICPVGTFALQPSGLEMKHSTTTYPEQDHMDLTQSHTHVINSRGLYKFFPPIMPENQEGFDPEAANISSDSCDMEFTKSQTAPINFKAPPLVNSQPSNFSLTKEKIKASDSSLQKVRVSEYDEPIQQEVVVSKFLFPFANRISTFESGNGDAQHDVGHHRNVVPANTEDMELTESQTVVVENKNREAVAESRHFHHVTPAHPTSQDMEMTQCQTAVDAKHYMRGEESGQLRKTLLHVPPADSDDMEMTQCQTVVVEAKRYQGNKPSGQSRVSFSQVPLSCSDEMEMTQSQTVVVETKQSWGDEQFGTSRRPFSCVPPASIEDERVKSQTGHETKHYFRGEPFGKSRKSLSLVRSTSSEDMEMTQCQTVVVEAKHCRGNEPLSNPRKSLSHFPPANSDAVEMTECQTVFEGTKHCLGSEPLYKSREKNSDLTPANLGEMEMMQCVIGEAEHNKEDESSDNVRKGYSQASLNSTENVEITQSHNDMDMTNALTGHIKLNCLPVIKTGQSSFIPSGTQTSLPYKLDTCMELTNQTRNSGLVGHFGLEDMELTGCQTATVHSKSISSRDASERKGAPCVSIAGTTEVITKGKLRDENASLVLPFGETEQGSAKRDESLGKVFPANGTVPMLCPTEGIPLELEHQDPGSVHPNPTNPVLERRIQSSNIVNEYKTSESAHNERESEMFMKSSEESEIVEEARKMSKCVTDPREDKQGHSSQGEIMNNETKAPSTSFYQSAVDEIEPEATESCDSLTPANGQSMQDEPDASAIARRKSLTNIQMKLQNIASLMSKPTEEGIRSISSPVFKSTFPETSDNDSESVKAYNDSSKPTNKKIDHSPDNFVQNEHLKSLNLERPLSARLSCGSFLPKLPPRLKPARKNQTETLFGSLFGSSLQKKDSDEAYKLNSYLTDDIDINDMLPEISSEEDLSETLKTSSMNKVQEEQHNSQREPSNLDLDVLENATSPSLKRTSPDEGHDDPSDERNKRQFVTSAVEKGAEIPCGVAQWDSYVPSIATEEPPSLMTKTIDGTNSSSNSSNLRCEGTLESSYKHSQCDSQMDMTTDHEFDFNKKIEDGSITVDEFLRNFGINFVIHRSRPSALPDNFKNDEERTMADLLKERYINRPKQRVYEADCQKLTVMVDGLKTRMLEQDHSLKSVNGSLWQEISEFSKEQLQRFGSKLKERKVHFRKRSKALSHEMKETLYSQLVSTTQESRKTLKGKIEETEELLRDVDECINNLEAEQAEMDVKMAGKYNADPEVEPDLREKQQELQSLNTAVAEKERQHSDLEEQKRGMEEKLIKMREETAGLNRRISDLNGLNEWRLAEWNENTALFTFLHQTLKLKLIFHDPIRKGKLEDGEKNMTLSFHLQLDEGKSQCFAAMVHKLLAQYVQDEKRWIQKYPTTCLIPVLLHDVSLVVSRLRLLGEEVHRLRKSGALRLGIEDIHCVDTQVHIRFSSLKAFVKFELSLAVSSEYPLARLHMQSFQNCIGNARADQIEEILASVAPTNNYLTKIVMKIHEKLLC